MYYTVTYFLSSMITHTVITVIVKMCKSYIATAIILLCEN